MKRSHKKRLFGAAALAGAAFLGTCIWALQSALGVSQYEVALPQWIRNWSRHWNSYSPI